MTEPSDRPVDAATLFRAHAAFVAAFLRRLGVASAELDDLVQEVFLVAHRKGGYVPGTAQPRTWLAAISYRVASARRRGQLRRREVGEPALASLPARQASPAETLEARQALGRVQQALDALDVEHRAAFVLYEIDGESCADIAAAFGVPVGTIYSRLHHARRRFLKVHAALGGESESGVDLPSTETA